MLLFICTVLQKLHRVFGAVHSQKLLLLFQDLLHESGVIPLEDTFETRMSKRLRPKLYIPLP